jgi:hypothetical protein
MRQVWAWLVVGLLLSSCGGGPSSGSAAITPRDRTSGDLFELVTSFEGQARRFLGSSKEWYAPRTGLHRVEHRFGSHSLVDVYDGSTIARRTNAGVFRIEGERAMLRYVVSRPMLFEEPAIVAVASYLGRQHIPSLVVRAHNGGRSFDADFHYVDEGVDTHIRYRVDVRSRLSEREARSRGLLRPPSGATVGIFKQSPAGTHPHFGERAYWFGPRLGPARAVTALERRGGDPFMLSASRFGTADYTTMYRLPKTSLPTGLTVKTRGRYPGLNNMLPVDLRLQCQAKQDGFLPGLAPGTKGTSVRLQSGEHSTLYLSEYRQGDRVGVMADIVVGKTICFISGLLSPSDLRRLAPTLRPL